MNPKEALKNLLTYSQVLFSDGELYWLGGQFKNLAQHCIFEFVQKYKTSVANDKIPQNDFRRKGEDLPTAPNQSQPNLHISAAWS
jgi:hypothetical protein